MFLNEINKKKTRPPYISSPSGHFEAILSLKGPENHHYKKRSKKNVNKRSIMK